MDEPKYCFIQFKFSYNTKLGEEIRIVGDVPELGNWDPEKGERLITSKADFPIWRSKENIKVKQNSEINYKYVIYDHGKFSRWEEIQLNKNRTVNIKNYVRVVIYDTQNNSTSQIERFTKLNYEIESPESENNFIENENDYNKFDLREPQCKKFFLFNNKEYENLPNINQEGTMTPNPIDYSPGNINTIKNSHHISLERRHTTQFLSKYPNQDAFENNIDKFINQENMSSPVKNVSFSNLQYQFNQNNLMKNRNKINELDFNIHYEYNKEDNKSEEVMPEESYSASSSTRNIRMKQEFADLNYSTEEEVDYLPHSSKNVPKDLNEGDKIIFASLYLPLRASKDKNGKWNIHLTNEPFYNTIYNLSKDRNICWIGLLKNYWDIDEENREGIVTTLLKKYNMFVIKLSKETTMKLCRVITTVLEPHFHYISILHGYNQIKEFEELWRVFKEFNELVAKQIMLNYKENSLVFLHDFHLLLTPSLIYNSHQNYNTNKNFKNIPIGLYIHSPFPAHDLFRRFPFREEILKSMLNCSLIGFHTFDSSRNFLTSCKRLLLINYESNINGDLAISYFGRNVIIRVKHVSSEPDLISKEIQTQEFKNIYQTLKEKYKGKYIYVSVDNLMFLAGVRHKLEGYRRFLREIGEGCSNHNVLIQYIYQDDSLICEDERKKISDLKHQIKELYKNIQIEFGETVIEIVEKKISYAERLGILAAGNCFVRTCRRESFSLDIYEFLNLKILLNDFSDLSYILSGLSGVTTSLSGAVKVNPFDFQSIQKGFMEAFQVFFDKEEMTTSQKKDLLHVKKNTASQWLFSFLTELKNTTSLDENAYYLGSGIGLNFRLIKISSDFNVLKRKSILEDYEKAKKRLFLLDYEGTLPSSNSQNNAEYYSKGSAPHPKILNVLDHLTKDKRNTIFIITGRESKLVSNWFSCVPELGLASEHGYLYRYNSYHKDKWEKLINDINIDWRSYTIEQLEPYTERCEGSFIEIKESSVVWQYRDCDPELGKAFSNVITIDLENSLKSFNLNIINGKGYVEVKPNGINKGAFASFILREEILKKRAPDFVLCIGDDTSDEEMFKFFKRKRNQIKNYIKNPMIFTVTVGKKPSQADSYLESISDVKSLMEAFMQISLKKRFNTSFSLNDIRSLNNQHSDTTIENSNCSHEKNFVSEMLDNTDNFHNQYS